MPQPYLPSLAEIEQRAAAIRAEWSDEEMAVRSGQAKWNFVKLHTMNERILEDGARAAESGDAA